MDNMDRCYNCMAEKNKGAACLLCGPQSESEPNSQLYLPLGYLLNSRYIIGKVVGSGGFGVVYVAWDDNLDIRVAVKEFLPKDLAARSHDHVSLTPYTGNSRDDFAFGVEKFLDEAKALAKFQDHPGIVSVHESFRANGTAYMIMQYLDGMTLKEYLKRQPGEKVSFTIAVKALVPIMDALREVHKAGFVHRDVSPDNIFITRQQQVKLLDFGSARYAIGEHSKSLTSVLKHGYSPIEQYTTKGNQGPWTDVYAVAATLYRCITGIVPHDSLDRLENDSIVLPRSLGVDIPASSETTLMSGMAIKAANRIQDIKLFQEALLGKTLPTDKNIEKVLPSAGVKYVRCPECNANNQIQDGDNSEELRCGKCKRELGIKPISSISRKSPEIITQSNGSKPKPKKVLPALVVSAAIIIALIVLVAVMAESPEEQYNKSLKLTTVNQQKSLELLKKSAEHGHPPAQYTLGYKYLAGDGIPKDTKKAAEWLQKATDNGDAKAKILLGIMYYLGDGVQKDLSKAESYIAPGADAGDILAQNYLGKLYFDQKRFQDALRYFKASADQGEKRAQYALGVMYANGLGVESDYVEAEKWYRKAATQGHEDAIKVLNKIDALSRQYNAYGEMLRR